MDDGRVGRQAQVPNVSPCANDVGEVWRGGSLHVAVLQGASRTRAVGRL